MRFDPAAAITTSFQGQVLWSPAVFTELELKPIPELLILPGVRADYFERVHQTIVQPRLTVRYQVRPQVALKGGVGLFVEEPTFDETDKNFGNPALKSERAIHWSAGVEYKPRAHITLDATGFYKDLTNLVSRTTATAMNSDGTVRPLTYDNAGVGRAYGLEIVARHEFAHNFTGWLAYTLSRSERRDSGAAGYRLFDFDQTHILAVLGSYQLLRNWTVGGRFRYVTGNPTTPVVGAVFNASRDQYDAVFGAVNSSRIGAFHQLDLRVDKKWIYNGWMLNVYLDLQNVYNRENPEAITYNFNFRQSKPQQGLPVLPILGIRGEF
jgi:outer membrane receptor for ferrienterochelin and colicin